MKINSKFLIFTFALALISTPKVESKVTLHSVLTNTSIVNTIVSPLAAFYYVTEAANTSDKKLAEENSKKFLRSIVESLTALPTSYCLYKETKNNTFLSLANAALCLYCLSQAMQEHNNYKAIDKSWTSTLTLGYATESNKQKHSQNANAYALATLYYALVAYQLNK